MQHWVVYGVAGRGSDWLGSYDWAPHTWCVDGNLSPVVQQGVESLMGKVTTSAECKKCDMLLPVPGRSYEHGGKGAPRSPNQPVKAVGHSFQYKRNPFEEMFMKTCISLSIFDL